MADIFLKVLNMSLSAGWRVLAVLVLRLALAKAPKWIHVLLWGMVAVRLVCPFTLESVLSLIPSPQVVSPSIMMEAKPQIHSGVEFINSTVNPILSQVFAPTPEASVNPLQILIPVGGGLWLAGMFAMLLYAAVSYFRLERQVRDAFHREGCVYVSQKVTSPFILGFIRPRVYLPANMDAQTQACVMAHELSHIRRRDHWWKPLGFLLLSVHWFNPLMWVAYILLCRDIEMACDEKAIRGMERQQRADYSQALLQCSISGRAVTACPLAFGEVSVKQRIQSVLRYKKPGFWIVLISLILCTALAVCFLTDPKKKYPAYNGRSLAVWIQDGDSANKGEVRWNFFDIEEFEGVTLPGSNPIKLTLAKVTENGLWLQFDTPLLHDGSKTMELFLKPVDRITLMTPTAGGATWYGFSIVKDSMLTGEDDFFMSMYTPLEGLPPKYSSEQAQQDGCVVMKNGDVVYGKDIWWNFYTAAQAGTPSGVRIMDSYEDFQVTMDLTYDGIYYRIRWLEDMTEHVREYKHLLRFQGNAESSHAAYTSYERYILTNTPNVSWTGIWNRLLNSQVPPAETDDFMCVYTNLIYSDEPGYGTLASAMRHLEPMMAQMKIVTLDVNEINWTLDIQVSEKVEGLEELVYSLLPPEYVRISQFEGTLRFTEESQDVVMTLEDVIAISEAPESLMLRMLAQYKAEDAESFSYYSTVVYEIVPEDYRLCLSYDFQNSTVLSLRLFLDNGVFLDVLNENVEKTLTQLENEIQTPLPDKEETEMLNAALETVCSGPLEQSNPGAYIDAQPEAYRILLDGREKTLAWAFGEFLTPGSNHHDLRGHILAQACRDIMASWGEIYEMNAFDLMTGGAWFQALTEKLAVLKKTTGVGELRSNHPGAWILIHMIPDRPR